MHFGQMEVLENIGNRVLKKDDSFDETFYIQLIEDFVSALVYVLYKLPFKIWFEQLY